MEKFIKIFKWINCLQLNLSVSQLLAGIFPIHGLIFLLSFPKLYGFYQKTQFAAKQTRTAVPKSRSCEMVEVKLIKQFQQSYHLFEFSI